MWPAGTFLQLLQRNGSGEYKDRQLVTFDMQPAPFNPQYDTDFRLSKPLFALAQDWGLEKSAFGPVFSANLLGLTLGSMAVTPLADRFGVRRILLACVLIYATLTVLMVFADSLNPEGATTGSQELGEPSDPVSARAVRAVARAGLEGDGAQVRVIARREPGHVFHPFRRTADFIGENASRRKNREKKGDQ